MAVYISIIRCMDTPEYAEYRLELSRGRTGRVRLDKRSGEVTLLEPIPGDEGLLYFRAAFILKKHWAKGEVPERTCWAS